MAGVSTKVDSSYAALLAQEFPKTAGLQADPTYCAALKNRVAIDRQFYVIVQGGIVVLALGVVTALLVCLVRLLIGYDIASVVGAVGSVVTGAGTAWLQKYATSLNQRWNTSLKALKDAGCGDL